ncbi:MAG: hypothetical protein AMXMBFR84_22610 [Candidatus Hydrogenedentota bacterium]
MQLDCAMGTPYDAGTSLCSGVFMGMANELTKDSIVPRLPKRFPDAHKGVYGHLFVLAGSRGMTGAARLAAESAGRSGVGLVTVGAPESSAAIIASGTLESMTFGLPENADGSFSDEAASPAIGRAKDMDAVVVGMGISQHADTRRFIHSFLVRCPVPVVIDADGLNCVSVATSLLRQIQSPVIITPHPGEMARLTGASVAAVQSRRESTAVDFAREYKCVVVLKGHRTIVATPAGGCWINPTGNSGMATGGSGDVLAGLIGGLVAQGLSVEDAGIAGVYLHGLAGDIAAERMTERGMIARDIVGAIPDAWRRLEAH